MGTQTDLAYANNYFAEERQQFYNVRSLTSCAVFFFCPWCSTPHWTAELWQLSHSLRSSVALHEISTNYQDTKQPHTLTVSTSNVPRCKCNEKEVPLGGRYHLQPQCCTEHRIDLVENLAQTAHGSREMQTLARKLFLCNEDNVSHITLHLQSHHSDRFI